MKSNLKKTKGAILFLILLINKSIYPQLVQSVTYPNNFEGNNIKKLNFIEPYCSFICPNDSNLQINCDSNRNFVLNAVNNYLDAHKKALRINEKVIVLDSSNKNNFYKDIFSVLAQIPKKPLIRSIVLPSTIQSVLNSQDEEYLMLPIYYRELKQPKSKKEKEKQNIENAAIIATSVAIGIATVVLSSGGFMFIPFLSQESPKEKGSFDGFYFLILNKPENKIVYYKKVSLAKGDYLFQKRLYDELDYLFKMFLNNP
jgi:hypothetical protein